MIFCVLHKHSGCALGTMTKGEKRVRKKRRKVRNLNVFGALAERFFVQKNLLFKYILVYLQNLVLLLEGLIILHSLMLLEASAKNESNINKKLYC